MSNSLWSEMRVASYSMMAMPQNMEKFVSICEYPFGSFVNTPVEVIVYLPVSFQYVSAKAALIIDP